MRLLLLVFLFINWGVSGKAISEAGARKVAMNWVILNGAEEDQQLKIKSIHPRYTDDRVLSYLVLFEPRGWIFLAATDLVEPVLAYSFETLIDPENLPIQMQEWMGGIQHEIIHAFSKDYKPASVVQQKWYTLSSDAPVKMKSAQAAMLGPLLTCTWDQGRYYNEQAPYDPSSTTGNNHVWIGCVATAMAQMMHYWAYPSNGLGSNSYFHPDYGLQSADFENTTYDWSAMPNRLTEGNFQVQQLNYHTAVSINMDFDPLGSGAYLTDVKKAMVGHFRYNSTLFESSKNLWEDQQWKQLLRNEMNAGRPILYSGYNAAGTSGHAFVCDGYSGEYFHFNWGWGGYANGNFLLSALNPGGTNYSYNQAAVIGIAPITLSALQYPYVEGFENANTGKLVLTGVGALTSDEKHSGNFSIRLSEPGFSSQSVNSVSLTFIVPSEGQLSFWVKRKTPAISNKNQQKAVLYTQYGETVLETIFDGDFNDVDWVNYTVDLSAFAGNVLRLHFVQENIDVVKEQWMFIDDVVITGSGDNLVPFVPSAPVPANLQTGVELNTWLRWAGGDPNGNAVTYTLHFGKSANPPKVASLMNNAFQPGTLDHSAQYFWRIVSNDGQLETTGPVWSFTTRNLPPSMELCGVSEVTASSAKVCGKLISTNNSNVSSRGICYSTTPNPGIEHQQVQADNSLNTYSCMLTNLQAFTRYYVSAYAISDEGIAFSDVSSFHTLAALPMLDEPRVEALNRSSAHVHNNIISMNDSAIFQYGVLWSVHAGFDLATATRIIVDDTLRLGAANFSVFIENLPGPGVFYYRTFAVNSTGITYSIESSFETINNAPVLLVDPDQSSGATAGSFEGKVTEQKLDGWLVDYDAYIYDPDNDHITSLAIKIEGQIKPDKEYLFFTGIETDCQIYGNQSDSLVLETQTPLNAGSMLNLLKQIVLFIDVDAPDLSYMRKISIRLSDGMNWGEPAFALLKVIPVNDPPLNTMLPAIHGKAEIGSSVSVVRGQWADVADQQQCSFQYQYQWEKLIGTDTLAIEGAISTTLEIDEALCGTSIRVRETVIDVACGGSNVQSVSAYSDWRKIERSAQSIVFDPIPVQQFSLHPYILNGRASSGLPVSYGMTENPVAQLSNDSIFFKGIGRIAVSCFQTGNECYWPAEKVYRMLIVEMGSQNIVVDLPDTVMFSDGFLPMNAYSTAGLPISVALDDSEIASLLNDTLFFHQTGNLSLTFTQEGNSMVLPADPLTFSLTIEKGQQLLAVNFSNGYQYGQPPIDLELAVQSDLPPVITLSDTSVLQLKGHFLEIIGVGTCLVSIAQPGNNLYLPVAEKQVLVEVTRGDQLIEVHLPELARYGDEMPDFSAENSSGLPVSIRSSNSGVIGVNNQQLQILGAGSAVLYFFNEGNELWNEVEKPFTVEVLKGFQSLNFEMDELLVYGIGSVPLTAYSSAGLLPYFSSSDTTVARIKDNYLMIENAGATYITANQDGNINWEPAESVSILLTVDKASQRLECFLNDTIMQGSSYGFDQFSTSSGLPIDHLYSGDETVASIVNNQIIFSGAGAVKIYVEQSGNKNYHAINGEFAFEVIGTVAVPEWEVPTFSLYPNPANEEVIILLEQDLDQPYEFRIASLTGQLYRKAILRNRHETVSLDGIPAGVYLVEVQIKGVRYINKLLVQ